MGKAFDPELARKAQIAFDHKLPVNFQQLELIEESLPRLLEEKAQLETLRAEVAKLPPGKYDMPQVDISAARPVPGQKISREHWENCPTCNILVRLRKRW